MTILEARAILSLYRPQSEDEDDPFFAEALHLARQDKELAKWFADEISFDEIIAGKLAEQEVPARLRATLLASVEARPRFQWNWFSALGLAAATAAVTLLVSLGFHQPAGKESHLVDNYRTEMVGFVDLPPTLAVETNDLQKVSHWLAENTGTTPINFPSGARQLPALGCRALTYHGYQVGLTCFQRKNGQLVHLLVVNRAAFGQAELPAERQFAKVGEWATATWSEGDKVYLLATKGDRPQLETYL